MSDKHLSMAIKMPNILNPDILYIINLIIYLMLFSLGAIMLI